MRGGGQENENRKRARKGKEMRGLGVKKMRGGGAKMRGGKGGGSSKWELLFHQERDKHYFRAKIVENPFNRTH